MRQRITLFLVLAIIQSPLCAGEPDILVADFESDTYGEWQVEGEAFGPGPAAGTLPHQMDVSGFRGDRLVNSFNNGDGTTGTLTSPPFEVNRDYLVFLIGGGAHEGKTCINLLREGEIVRTATGPNSRPGGSEELAPHYWDVSEFRGKTVTIQIVDKSTGGWGHINVDHIVFSDVKPKLPRYERCQKSFTVGKKYLIIPIDNGAKTTDLVVSVDGKPVRDYSTELATDQKQVDWYAFFTIESYQGRSATVTASRATEEGFALIRQADKVPGSETWYTEKLRPQFHFSQIVGWNNDPNGMVYHDGEWHLYFQHNPVGWKWGNMTWGHAVSSDLVHWTQLPCVLFPKTMAQGDCFSGSANVDAQNTAGFKIDENDVLCAFLTDTGAGEAVAYSTDRGRTFTWYEGNPVVRHNGRDPKVIWYAYDQDDTPLNDRAKELGGHWVMVVYDQHEKYGRNAAFYSSTDLKEWQEQSHLPGYYECTELFELPVDGREDDTRWIVFAADARYAVGHFDGRVFTPEHDGKHQVHYGAYYASQTFSNPPDGRKIQIGWARIAMPGMPFNQTFTFPHRLTLRSTTEGIRMFAEPVREIEKLHRKTHAVTDRPLSTGESCAVNVNGELFDIRATFAIGTAQQVGVDIGGERVTYHVPERRLDEAALNPVDGKIAVQILVDRPMVEIIGNGGRVYVTKARAEKGNVSSIKAFAVDGDAKLVDLKIHELASIWK